MIFSVQHFLEDYFERRGLADVDQYAIRVANLFERCDAGVSKEILARKLSRVRTAFFRRNKVLNRQEFELALGATIRHRFKKKRSNALVERFERDLPATRVRLRAKRRSVALLLAEFKKAVEAKAIDAFWTSRKKGVLQSRPEKHAQALLAVFAKGVVGSDGLVLRELASGVGFVDIGISFGRVLHLIELKIFNGGSFKGADQLATYMKTEGRKTGWLVLIDTRRKRNGKALPDIITTAVGHIMTVIVNVNPSAPSD